MQMNMRDGQESSEQIQRQGPGILPNRRNGHDGHHGYDDFTEFTKELVEHLAVAITFEISRARGFVASEEELTVCANGVPGSSSAPWKPSQRWR